ncbi:hypothetical protein GGX14DRAFT_407942 [Mycena pura]|uniref:Uncharacterized protein n=1 Tax=Mycena pura TaxID=153505 RepID=A0AAD6Y023_9AGAR|nr:hypothetical protein GGX14DRAFT_407942 [Mycena pura]
MHAPRPSLCKNVASPLSRYLRVPFAYKYSLRKPSLGVFRITCVPTFAPSNRGCGCPICSVNGPLRVLNITANVTRTCARRALHRASVIERSRCSRLSTARREFTPLIVWAAAEASTHATLLMTALVVDTVAVSQLNSDVCLPLRKGTSRLGCPRRGTAGPARTTVEYVTKMSPDGIEERIHGIVDELYDTGLTRPGRIQTEAHLRGAQNRGPSWLSGFIDQFFSRYLAITVYSNYAQVFAVQFAKLMELLPHDDLPLSISLLHALLGTRRTTMHMLITSWVMSTNFIVHGRLPCRLVVYPAQFAFVWQVHESRRKQYSLHSLHYFSSFNCAGIDKVGAAALPLVHGPERVHGATPRHLLLMHLQIRGYYDVRLAGSGHAHFHPEFSCLLGGAPSGFIFSKIELTSLVSRTLRQWPAARGRPCGLGVQPIKY